MRTMLRILVGFMAMLAFGIFARGDLTNVWPFTSAPEYQLSDSNKIEVADGEVKLKLQRQNRHEDSIADYYAASTSVSRLEVDSDVVLIRSAPYIRQATFTSPVLVGESGNVWQRISAVSSATDGSPGLGGLSPNEQGIVALYHLDNDAWLDAVSGGNGTPMGGASRFSSTARVGTASGDFSGGFGTGFRLVNPSLLSGVQGFTIVCWIYLRSYKVVELVTCFGNRQIGLELNPGNRVGFNLDYRFGGNTDIPLNKWCHVACTWSSVGGRARVYLDGVVDGERAGVFAGYTIVPGDYFYCGEWEGVGYSLNGLIDEVALYGRELSASEIADICRRPKSVGLQVRSGTTPAALAVAEFSGPDVGSPSNSYYRGDLDNLVMAGGFVPTHRYMQYRLYMLGEVGDSYSPVVDSVTVFGSSDYFPVNTFGDFASGALGEGLTNTPATRDAPFLGLSKKPNGGYYKSGTYTSRPLQAEEGQVWHKLKWSVPAQTDRSDSRLLSLWRMNFTAFDELGLHNGISTNVSYSELGKLGGYAAVFDGRTSKIDVAGYATSSVMAVEFWMKTDRANGGLLGFGTPSSGQSFLLLTNGSIRTSGFSGKGAVLYLNGVPSGSRVQPGWNHVALTLERPVSITNVTIGCAGGMYFSGMIDEVALYGQAVGGMELKSHVMSGIRDSCGSVKFRVRGSDSLPMPSESVEPFRDTGGGTTGYITDNTGGSDFSGNLPSVARGRRYLQYRAYFESDGVATPTAGYVGLEYYGGVKAYTDDSLAELARGSFDGGLTAWRGTEMKLRDVGAAPGLIDMDVSLSGLVGLWHMNETNWPSGPSVIDSRGGRNGLPQGGPTVSPYAKVGVRSGVFDGVDDYVMLASGLPLAGDCTVCAWFQTTASNRSAVVSHDTGAYALEINSDGTSADAGRVAFTVDTGTRAVAAGGDRLLNDGLWHHVAGIRKGDGIYLLVDGVPDGAAKITGTVGELNGGVVFGRRAPASEYFSGSIDEVAVFDRALTVGEVQQLIAAGRQVGVEGKYVSQVYDATGPAIWEKMVWQEDAPYGDAMTSDVANVLVGLWHFDEGSGTAAADSSGNGQSGTLYGGASWTNGCFAGALSLSAGGYAKVTRSFLLEPAAMTVEAWIRPDVVGASTVVDKRDAGNGYAVGIGADAKPYFWFTGSVCRASCGILAGVWTHLAASFDGEIQRIYVNGQLVGDRAAAGSGGIAAGDLSIGVDYLGGNGFVGRIDEVAVHGRALNSEEIMDHARSGSGVLRFQARSGSSVAGLLAAPFVGADGTSSTFFETASGSSMIGSLPLAQYFQLAAYLQTDDGFRSPRMQGLTIAQSRYPSDRPWVAPAKGFTTNFVGRLLSFRHQMTTNVDSAVRYQVSGDGGTNWYWWNGLQWELDGAGLGWVAASPAQTVDNRIGTFYEQLHQGKGGVFSFKGYLDSDGATQTAVDYVEMVKSKGRITVLRPNGSETGSRAWLVGTPYDITWSWTGTVGGVVMVDLSKDGGTNVFRRIGTNVANNGKFTTVISEEPGSSYRIKVSDPSDGTIYDWSDGNFELRALLHLSIPNGGEHWYCGKTNNITWESPKSGGFNLEGPAWLWFSPDAGATWSVVLGVSNYNGRNSYAWRTPADNAALRASLPTMPLGYEHLLPSNLASIVSETALMGVSVPGAANPYDVNFYGDTSDATFTNAGMGITFPYENVGVRMGNVVTIEWKAAGAGTRGATIEFFDGQTWSLLSSNALCGVGMNTFDAILQSDRPSTAARIRITANADTNVVGVSDAFTLADVNIVEPVGRGGVGSWSIWQLGAAHNVRWTAAGAGDRVNILYSTDSGVNWLPVALDYPNLNSSGTLITNVSSTWTIPGPPSDKVRVRVQSTAQTNLYTDTGDFDFSGAQVKSPNGTALDGIMWEFSQGGTLAWRALSAGAQLSLMIAYEDNPATNDFEVLIPGVTAAAGSWNILPQLLRRPSNYARVRVVAPNPPPEATEFVPMADVSDTNFVIRGVSMVEPTQGDVFTLARTVVNGLQWISASAGSGIASVFYSSNNGQTFGSDPFMAQVLNEDDDRGTGHNVQNIVLPRTLTPSETARLKLVAGSYSAFSPPFVARGIRITSPASGATINLGTPSYRVQWLSAGLASNATSVADISFAGLAGPWQSGGLPGGILVSSRELTWALDPDLLPSTNATIRMSVDAPSQDTDVVMYSDPFLLRGVKVVRPAQGEVLELGLSSEVSVVSAGMGLDRATVEYSADGGLTYDGTPVFLRWALSDGSNALAWAVESSRDFTRMPSADARLRVVCGTATNLSKPFTVRGLKVTAPTRTDIWSSAETNTIRWVDVGVGGPYSLYLVQWMGTNRLSSSLIASGLSGSSYEWAMAPGTVASNVSIEVRAGVRASSSEMFEVVAEPTVRIVSPASGEFWKVGSTNVIRWSRGGSMSDQFAVYMSQPPYTDSVLLYSGACPLADGMFSYVWAPVTNAVGPTRIFVTNLVNEGVFGRVDGFHVAGRFAITPFGPENYALSTKTVNWVTYGTVTMVDLYYSTDPLRAPENWVKINATPYAGNIGHRMPATPYPWQLPQIKTPIMYLRVQDHSHTEAFSADRIGPYDDMGPFPVNYYTITWFVLDDENQGHLSRLSVSDSSGWSEANLSSPVVHEYPYGTWDTVWFREYFNDGVVFNWTSDSSRTNIVIMKQNVSERGIQVLGDFSFDLSANRLTVLAWIQRAGQILRDPTRCDVAIYSAAGQTVHTLSSTSVQQDAGEAVGVFRMEWDGVTNVLAYGSNYFAKVAIEYSGKTYSSVVTYSLRVPADATQAGQILDAIGSSQVNVQSNVLAVAATLDALAAAQSAFRTNALDRLSAVASNVSAILPAVTNIEARVSGIETSVSGTKSRILTRPETMVFGTTNTILYKSTPGFGSTVSLVVSNSFGGGPVAQVTTMGEVVAGLYQSDLIANWGSNSYVITCYDPPTTPQPGWDSIVVRVGAAPLTGNVALDQLLGDVARVEQRITNVTQMLSGLTNTTDILGYLQADLTNVLQSVTDMAVTVNTLTNLSTAAQVLTGLDWGAISNVGGLASSMTNLQATVTNIQASLNSVTNLSGAMVAINGIQGSVSNLQTSVGALTNLQSVVGVLTNVDWGAVSNIGGLSASMTNIQATLSLVQSSVGGVSNYVVLLTNLPALASNVTNIQGAVASLQSGIGGLTNLGQVVSVLTNVDWGSISNVGSIGTALADIQTSVTNMEASIGALANLGTVVASLTNVDWSAVSNVGGISASLTNIQGAVSGMQTTLGSVTNYMVTLTNLPAVASNVTNVQGAIANLQSSMSALTNLGTVVASLTNVNWNAVSNVGGIATSLTNIQSTVSGLQASVGAVSNYVVALTNLPSLTTSVTNMQGAIANIQASVNSLSNLGSVVSSLTNVDWSAVSNVGGLSVSLTNIQGQVGVIQDSLAALTNLGALASTLTNVDWSAVAGVSSLAGSVSNIQSSVTNISAIQASVNDLADKINGVDWDGLAGVPDSMNQFAPALQGLGTTAGSDIASIMRSVQDLSRQAGQSGTSISDVQSGVRAIQQAMEALNRLQDRLGTGDAGQPTDSLFTRLSVLADNVGKVAGDASDAAKNAMGAKTEAANASAGIQAVKDAMARGDTTGVAAGIDRIREQLAAVRSAIDGISPAKETASMEEAVKKMVAQVEAFSKSTGVKWLTEMKDPPKVGAGEGADEKRVEDLNAVLIEVRGRLEFLQKMIQDLRDKPVVEESLIGG